MYLLGVLESGDNFCLVREAASLKVYNPAHGVDRTLLGCIKTFVGLCHLGACNAVADVTNKFLISVILIKS